jgi:hypothetical protein
MLIKRPHRLEKERGRDGDGGEDYFDSFAETAGITSRAYRSTVLRCGGIARKLQIQRFSVSERKNQRERCILVILMKPRLIATQRARLNLSIGVMINA